ncbi:MAG TPA: hypothetical protein DHW82_07270 [Spirochaetia bacterium]|nr:hypothetical protein [Spirochaetia bacterium]
MKKLFIIKILIILFCVQVYSKTNQEKQSDEFLKQAASFVKSKDYDKALDLFEKAEKTSPNSGYYASKTGEFYLYQIKDFEKSHQKFLEAIEKGYQTSRTFRLIGESLHHLKKYNEALEYYQKSIENSLETLKKTSKEKTKEYERKNLTRSYGKISDLFNDQGEWEKAAQIALKGFETDPQSDDSVLLSAYFISNWWLGQIAFGEGDYDLAYECFQKALETSKKNESLIKLGEKKELELHLKIIEKRKKLGKITPEKIHKILSVVILNTDLSFQNLKGEPMTSKKEITNLQKKEIEICQKSLKAYWETFSNGKLSVEFQTIETDSTLKRLNVTEKKPGDDRFEVYKEKRQPDMDSFSPSLENLFYESSKSFDSFIFYWNGEDISTYANGGSRYYPVISYALFMKRGYSQIPAERLDWSGSALLLHEQMHNIESMLSQNLTIDASEKTRKKVYPEWEGSGEINYFEYLFQKQIPSLLSDSKKFPSGGGYANFNYTDRYPLSFRHENYQKLFDLNQKIKLEKRIQAQKLFEEAKEEWKKNNQAKALKILEEAYKNNPYHPDILENLGIYSEKLKKYDEALKYYQILSEIFPEVKSLNRLGLLLEWKLNKKGEGIPYFEKALELDPSNPYQIRTFLHLGKALLRGKKYEKALQIYEKGISFKESVPSISLNDWAECMYYKGIILAENLKQKKEGIQWIEKALENGLNHSQAKEKLKKLKMEK